MTQAQHSEQCRFLLKCLVAYHLVQAFLNDEPIPKKHHTRYTFLANQRQVVKDKVRKSLQVLETSLERHSIDEIAISYNGGKDCLVMLVLLMATIHHKYSSDDHTNPSVNLLPKDYKLDSIYVNSEVAFPELSDFIVESSRDYHLNLITVKSSLKEGFEHYLNNMNQKIKVIVVGIRYADPYGSQLQYEQTTDHDWPEFLRVHPVLHWNYVDVWDFLLGCDLPYCVLYDQGYTSLGGVDTTLPNEFLRTGGSYLPAYMLAEKADERERVGRIKR